MTVVVCVLTFLLGWFYMRSRRYKKKCEVMRNHIEVIEDLTEEEITIVNADRAGMGMLIFRPDMGGVMSRNFPDFTGVTVTGPFGVVVQLSVKEDEYDPVFSINTSDIGEA